MENQQEFEKLQNDNPANDSGERAAVESSQELKPETAGKIKDYTRKLLSQWIEDPDQIPGENATEEKILSDFEEITGDSDDLGQKTTVFFEELLRFCKENRRSKKLELFLDNLYSNLLNRSPSILDTVALEDHFNLTSATARIPKTRDILAGEFVSSLLWKIAERHNPSKSAEKLLESFRKSSVAEKFDKLHLVELLGAEARAKGKLAYSTKKCADSFLEQVGAENKSAFVGYYLETVQNRLKLEDKFPTRDFFSRGGDPSNARLVDFLSKEEKHEAGLLDKKIYPNRTLAPSEKILRVGKNVLAIYDHSNLPVEFSQVDFKEIKNNQSPVSGNKLVEFERFIEAQQKGEADIMIERFIVVADAQILRPYHNLSEEETDARARVWRKISKVLTLKQWKEYFELRAVFDKARQKCEKYQTGLREKLANENEAASDEFIKYFKEIAPRVINDKRFENSVLQADYQEFIEAYNSGDLEHAFQIALGSSRYLSLITGKEKDPLFGERLEKIESSEDSEALVSQCQELNEREKARRSECEEKIKEFWKKNLYEANESEMKRVAELFSILFDNREKIFSGFGKELEKIEKDVKQRLKNVSFSEYPEFMRQYASFLPEADQEDLGLLLQHLHRPRMRKFVEAKLDISFKDLPLLDHIYLLEFLVSKPEEAVQEVRLFLDQAGDAEAKNNRVKSFLSLESDAEMGERILEIGKRLEKKPELADRLFGEYARIVGEAEAATDELVGIYSEIFFEKKIDRDRAKHAILNKANDLLYWASEGLYSCEEDEKEKFIDDLISDLKRQERVQKKSLKDLKDQANSLNKMYNELEDEIRWEGIPEKELARIKKEVKSVKKKWERKIKQDERLREVDEWDKQAKLQLTKYDSDRIKELIVHYNFMYSFSEKEYEHIKQKYGEKNAEIYREISSNEKINNKYRPKIRELKELLKLQTALERGLDGFVYGDKSTKLPKDLEAGLPDKIFQKYNEIVKLAEKSKVQLKDLFKSEREISDAEIDGIADVLLAKANKVLADFFDRIKRGETIDEAAALKELEDYQDDLVLTAAVFKEASKRGASLEDFKDMHCEKLTAEELTRGGEVMDIVKRIFSQGKRYPIISLRDTVEKEAAAASEAEKETVEQILEMLEIYRRNYADKNPKFQAELLDGFIGRLSTAGEKTNLYILSKSDETLGFNRFDVLGPGKKYFGSCNVRPALQDSSLGKALFAQSLRQEAPGYQIEAHCEAFAPISSVYIETGKFRVDQVLLEYGEGPLSFHIVRDKEPHSLFENASREELIKEYITKYSKEKEKKLLKRSAFVLKFAAGSPELLETAARMVNENGYSFTRFFFGKDRKNIYCAFEKGGS